MDAYATTNLVDPRKLMTKSTRLSGWSAPNSLSRATRFYAIVTDMSSKFVAAVNTNAPAPATDTLEERWDRIMSCAGALKDSDELTPEWLADFRQSAWGSRWDDIDDEEQTTTSVGK